jgi:hypothetical protein
VKANVLDNRALYRQIAEERAKKRRGKLGGDMNMKAAALLKEALTIGRKGTKDQRKKITTKNGRVDGMGSERTTQNRGHTGIPIKYQDEHNT